ncbi:MFS transporter [Flavobacteriaceae bacterium]|nr:MFS transporter [Flavobacteriaceae bacterium]MDB9712638.1 MFS transporter [Flavobacteriaceae bacterium]MDC1491808.1 MFS transporter [Flavobacteriaceae bacterium]
MKIYQKGDKKLLNAWAFYDWANSVYPLVISTAIFPIYYGFITGDNEKIHFLGFDFETTALISFVTAIAFMFLVVITPILSGIADYTGLKKSFMKFFCFTGSVATISLYWFDIDNLTFGLIFYFIAMIGFWGSLVFYNSYLPEIAHEDQQDSISAKGYSMGYFGSVILLILNLIMVNFPDLFGITSEGSVKAPIMAMKISFVTVGIWWFVFSLYTFYYLPNPKVTSKVNKSILFNGFKELKEVWKTLKLHPYLKSYLLAFFIYSIALQTVILVATYFGEKEINWAEGEKTTGLIISILIIQLIAIIGALVSAKISKKYGNIYTLIVLNVLWAILCFYGYFVESSNEFYIAAGLVGLVMGGIQALSRSTFSKFLPETDNTTSFFSFYDVTQKASIVIGMILFGTIDQITGSMRDAILFFTIFFAVGAFLLFRLDKKMKS